MFSAHGNSESEKFFEKLIRQTIFFFSSKQVLPSNFFLSYKNKQTILWAPSVGRLVGSWDVTALLVVVRTLNCVVVCEAVVV